MVIVNVCNYQIINLIFQLIPYKDVYLIRVFTAINHDKHLVLTIL